MSELASVIAAAAFILGAVPTGDALAAMEPLPTLGTEVAAANEAVEVAYVCQYVLFQDEFGYFYVEYVCH